MKEERAHVSQARVRQEGLVSALAAEDGDSWRLGRRHHGVIEREREREREMGERWEREMGERWERSSRQCSISSVEAARLKQLDRSSSGEARTASILIIVQLDWLA